MRPQRIPSFQHPVRGHVSDVHRTPPTARERWKRKVLPIVLTALSLAGCVPVAFAYYRPDAGPGRIEETGCWKLPDTIALDDQHGDGIRIHVDQFWPRSRVVIEFSVLGGNVVELTSPTIGVGFSAFGFGDSRPEAVEGSWAGKRTVFGPMSGNYGVYADVKIIGASRIHLVLPSMTVNGEEVTLPDVYFSKAYTARLAINC